MIVASAALGSGKKISVSSTAAQGGLARMPVKLLGQLRERHPASVPVRVLLGHASAGTVRASPACCSFWYLVCHDGPPMKALCSPHISCMPSFSCAITSLSTHRARHCAHVLSVVEQGQCLHGTCCSWAGAGVKCLEREAKA